MKLLLLMKYNERPYGQSLSVLSVQQTAILGEQSPSGMICILFPAAI
jgi:hypothetical protein